MRNVPYRYRKVEICPEKWINIWESGNNLRGNGNIIYYGGEKMSFNEKEFMEMDEFINEFASFVQGLEEEHKKRLSARVDSSGTLCDFLSMLKKDELCNIRRNLKIAGVSSLNKQRLVELLELKIRENINYIIMMLSEDAFNLLKKAVKSNGVFKHNFEEIDLIEQIQTYGIGFSGAMENGETVFIIPKEIIDDVKSALNDMTIISKIKRYHKCYRIGLGYLYFYGAAPIGELHFKIVMSMDDIGDIDVYDYIEHNMGYYYDIKYYEGYLYHWTVFNIQAVIKEQEKRPNLGYRPIPLESALEASNKDYICWNEYDTNLFKFLIDKMGFNPEDAAGIIENNSLLIKNSAPYDQMLDSMNSIISFPDNKTLNEFTTHFNEFYNNKIQPGLKGYSLNDLPKGKQNFLII